MAEFDATKLERLKAILGDDEKFPLQYTFKFIVPVQRLSQILGLFPTDENIQTKPSSKGTYISVTVVKEVNNPEEVIKVYETVSVVEGVVSL